MHQFAEPGDFTAGCRLVDHALAGRFVNKRDGAAECRAGGVAVTCGDGFTNLFDIGAHGGANMGVAGIANNVLTISLER